jgi:hypothetical protein
MSAIMGDVIHNLRSALDPRHELAKAAGHSDKGVYFPFCDQPEAGQGNQISASIGPGRKPSLLRKLETLPHRQYRLARDPRSRRSDKHKMLLPTFMTFAGPFSADGMMTERPTSRWLATKTWLPMFV